MADSVGMDEVLESMSRFKEGDKVQWRGAHGEWRHGQVNNAT